MTRRHPSPYSRHPAARGLAVMAARAKIAKGTKSHYMSIFRSVENYVRQSQMWGSVFRHGIPRDRRTRAMAILSNVFLHLHPVAVRKSGIRLSFTWCMGGLTFFLFLAETISASVAVMGSGLL